MKHFSVEFDLSEVLPALGTAKYLLLIDPDEFKLVCEVKQWIQISFKINHNINFIYNDAVIHENEHVRIFHCLGSKVRVQRSDTESCIVPLIRKSCLWNGIAVYPTVKKRLSDISSVVTEDSQVGPKLTLEKNSQEVTLSLPQHCGSIADTPNASSSGCEYQESEITKVGGLTNQSNQLDTSFTEFAASRKDRSLSIGNFLENLRNSQPSASHSSEVCENLNLPGRKRKRSRKHRKSKNLSCNGVQDDSLFGEPIVGPSHLHFEEDSGEEHVSDKEIVENVSNNIYREIPPEYLVKDAAGPPPVYVRFDVK